MIPAMPPRRRAPRAARRGLATGGALLGLTLAASACSVANTGSEGDTNAEDSLTIVLSEEPPTLEPCEASLTSTGSVVRSNITEPLVERDPTSGELDPLLAESWEQTSDTEWTFKVREGVKFSDGTAFDAEAAAYSIERSVNGDLACNIEGYVFGDVDYEVDAPDATTLTVTSPTPDPILPLRLSFVEVVPTSTDDTKKVREPVGTGPYQIDDWQEGQKLMLARNDGYWGEAPAYAEVEYQWRTEPSVRAAMVVNDEADVATLLGPEDGAGETAVEYPNNETTAIRMQATEPPLDDIRVRQAINYAIDREGIVESLFKGGAEVAAQLVPEGVVGHDPDLAPWPYDTAKAEDLLAEAEADGVDVDAEIRLIARTALFPKVEETVQFIQGELSDLGLNVKIQMVDTARGTEYQERPFVPDAGPYLLMIQHGNQAGDAAFSLDQYLLSDGFQSSYGTKELDQKIVAAEKLTGDERQEDLAEVFAVEPEMIGQYAYIAHMNGTIAVSDSVNYEPNSASNDEMRLAEMSPAN